MAGRMTVLAVRRTGHVLGAITTVAPGGTPSVASVAGTAMPAQLDSTSFAVPAANLAVADLAFDGRVFDDPQRARVVFPKGSDESASLGFVDVANHGEVDIPATGLTGTLTVTAKPGTGVVVPKEGLAVWVLFQGPPPDPPIVVTGVIPETKTTSDPVAHGLTAGTTYDALVLVTGLAPHLQSGITP